MTLARKVLLGLTALFIVALGGIAVAKRPREWGTFQLRSAVD
jgi:hypothetical protein